MFALDTYRGASSRLLGLTWGAEDLSTAIGASTNRGTRQTARSPRVLRTHLHAYACRIYDAAYRANFGLWSCIGIMPSDGRGN